MSTVRFGLSGACLLAAFFLVALFGASAAQGANSFTPAGEIGSGELAGPARIAVDPTTGNVLVVDAAEHRVDVYGSGPGASLLTTFGAADLASPYGIAIDPSNGDVYVTDSGNERILRYTTDGQPTPTYTLDAGYTGPAAGTGSEEVGSFASAIAVDPTDGDLLVADRGNERISRFDTTGAFVSSFDGSDSGAAFTHLEDLTLSPAGKIFVADGEATAGGASRVLRFSNAGAFEATLRPSEPSGDAYLAYDSKHTELIVGDGRECTFCETSIHVLDPSSGKTYFDLNVFSEMLTGVASDPGSGNLYAASSHGFFNIFGPTVLVLTPQMHPDLVLDTPEPITPFTAHLSGTVNPNGVATEYHFEVSKDGGTTWQQSPEPAASAGDGTTPVAVETDFTVEPNAHYLATLVASNTDGAQDSTPSASFDTEATAPGTETQKATEITEHSAALNGTVNPVGMPATYYFEYGLTSAYGSKTPSSSEGVAGSGRESQSVVRRIDGLAPGTTYHFRLVATNAKGSAPAADLTFTTAGANTIANRVYEQVSQPAKNGAAIIPGLGYQAAGDGNGLAYFTKSGSQAAPLEAYSVALRGADDWVGKIDTDPPVNAPEEGGIYQMFTLAISDDFHHALVASNRALTPGALERGTNLYLTDFVTGTKRLIAAVPGEAGYMTFVTSTDAGKFQGGAPDFSWLVFASPIPLLPQAPDNALYRWTAAGGLEVFSVLPDGDASSAVYAANQYHYQAVSTDGSDVYYTAELGSEEGVFLRVSGGPPKPISVSRIPGDPSTPQRATLLGATRDGRYAFFTCNTPLTPDVQEGVNQYQDNLYRYDLATNSLENLGADAEVRAPSAEGSSATIVMGSFGIGEDGNTIYFNGRARGMVSTAFMVWHSGETHVIETENLIPGMERVSPNGRYFAFNAEDRGLSGPIHLYDSATNQVTCVSCLPNGDPANGRMPEQGELFISNHRPRVVADDGTVYFDTTAQLVPRDVNGTSDVYSYRAGGSTLVSPGDAPFEAVLADVSEGGRDIFFTTEQSLVGRDRDQAVDIYDARIDGGFAAQNAPGAQECVRQCKEPPGVFSGAPPAGSESLRGPGEKKAETKKVTCKKGQRKTKSHGKAKCVKKKAHGAHKKASKSKKHKSTKNKKRSAR